VLFPVFVALAVLVGHALVLKRAKASRLGASAANRMVVFVLGFGFLGALIAKPLYDLPALLEGKPLIGISSFGGIAGGLCGALFFFRRSSMPGKQRWAYLDLLGFAFPFAWIFGRMGCWAAHDHPGVRAEGPLTHMFADGSRYDLGLIEMLAFAIPMAALFHVLSRRARPAGFYSAFFLIVYGPFRLLLDQLHESPPQLIALSVDQFASLAISATGLYIWRAAIYGSTTTVPRIDG